MDGGRVDLDVQCEPAGREDRQALIRPSSFREYGQGRVVYFPASVDKGMFFYPDTYMRQMLANAPRWAARDVPPPVEVDGPLILTTTFRRQPEQERTVVHLLNQASSWGMHSTYQKLAALPEELNKQWGFPNQSELRGTWPVREEIIPCTISRSFAACLACERRRSNLRARPAAHAHRRWRHSHCAHRGHALDGDLRIASVHSSHCTRNLTTTRSLPCPSNIVASFLKDAGLGIAAATACHLGTPVRGAMSPNERMQVGVIGPGGMGSSHLNELAGRQDVEVSYVCDADANRLAAAAGLVRDKTGRDAQAVKDLRQILDDKAVDAVFIATPDHWHAPATILACDGGKARVCGKALLAQSPRRAADGRGGAAQQIAWCRSARNRAARPTSSRRCKRCATGSSATCSWPRRGTASAAGTSAISSRPIRRRTSTSTCGSDRRPHSLPIEPVARRLALVVCLWRWRHRQRRRPRHRHRPLGPGRRMSSQHDHGSGRKVLLR